jgi:hypothetical protein
MESVPCYYRGITGNAHIELKKKKRKWHKLMTGMMDVGIDLKI